MIIKKIFFLLTLFFIFIYCCSLISSFKLKEDLKNNPFSLDKDISKNNNDFDNSNNNNVNKINKKSNKFNIHQIKTKIHIFFKWMPFVLLVLFIFFFIFLFCQNFYYSYFEKEVFLSEKEKMHLDIGEKIKVFFKCFFEISDKEKNIYEKNFFNFLKIEDYQNFYDEIFSIKLVEKIKKWQKNEKGKVEIMLSNKENLDPYKISFPFFFSNFYTENTEKNFSFGIKFEKQKEFFFNEYNNYDNGKKTDYWFFSRALSCHCHYSFANLLLFLLFLRSRYSIIVTKFQYFTNFSDFPLFFNLSKPDFFILAKDKRNYLKKLNKYIDIIRYLYYTYSGLPMEKYFYLINK